MDRHSAIKGKIRARKTDPGSRQAGFESRAMTMLRLVETFEAIYHPSLGDGSTARQGSRRNREL